jgi:hypothetical protein
VTLKRPLKHPHTQQSHRRPFTSIKIKPSPHLHVLGQLGQPLGQLPAGVLLVLLLRRRLGRRLLPLLLLFGRRGRRAALVPLAPRGQGLVVSPAGRLLLLLLVLLVEGVLGGRGLLALLA